jgi:hypothetical protein
VASGAVAGVVSPQLNVISNDIIASKFFRGVFAADQLPNYMKYPFSVIANTDEVSKKGMHWIAIHVDKHGYGEYFDSFGVKPWVNHHIAFINKNSIKWNFNNECLQNMYSSVCGHYCAVFVALKARRTPCIK